MSEFVRAAALIAIFAIIGGCTRTQVEPGLLDRETRGDLDGTFQLHLVTEGCEGTLGKDLAFPLLKPLEDSTTVEIRTVALPEKRDNITFTYTFGDGRTATRYVNVGTKYRWVSGTLWWAPIVRQHFPYILGVDRSWVKGEARVEGDTLTLVEERNNLRAGLLAVPAYRTERWECHLTRVPLKR